MSVNKAIIIGVLGKDPELKKVGSGQVCNFSVATTEFYKKDGRSEKKTEWHSVSIWGKSAENCSKYLEKGSKVYLEGSIKTRNWEDKETGKTVYKTEIHAFNVQFLSLPRKDEKQDLPDFDDNDGDLPF